MNYSQIIIGLAGGVFGGVVVAILQHLLDKRREIDLALNKILEDKYRSLLVFMACVLDIKKRRYFNLQEQTANRTSKDYMSQIQEYYYQGVLYSSDEVILSIKKFILKPNKENYLKTALEMRKDLWNKNTKLKIKDILID